MKNEWEHGIKPQFQPSIIGKEYIVQLPPELFPNGPVDDTKRKPHIKSGRIHFLGQVFLFHNLSGIRTSNNNDLVVISKKLL